MASDPRLPERLRTIAREGYADSSDANYLREAADALEAFEAADRDRPVPSLDGLPIGPHAYRLRLAAERADRDRLEHEAVSPEVPLIPMPHDFRVTEGEDSWMDRDAYREAMTRWVRAVIATERTRDGS